MLGITLLIDISIVFHIGMLCQKLFFNSIDLISCNISTNLTIYFIRGE